MFKLKLTASLLMVSLAIILCQDKVLAVDPEVLAKKALCHTCLAKIYVAQGDIAKAITEYQELFKIIPNDAAAHFEFASLLARNGKPDLSVPQYKLAAKLKPSVPEYQAGLGYALMCDKNFDAAVAAYSRACQLGGKYQEQLQNAQQYQAQQKLLEQYQNRIKKQQDD